MKTKSSVNDLDLRRLWRSMKRNWWLYALCFVLFFGAATIYSLFRMPVYDSHAMMIIEASSPESSLLAGAGGGSKSSAAMRMLNLGSAETANEMALLTSTDVMNTVVRKTGLNVRYMRHSGLSKEFLYPESPIAVEIPQSTLDTLTRGLLIKARLHDGKVDLRACKGPKGIITFAEANNVKLPYDFKNSRLNVRVVATGSWRPDLNEDIDIVVAGTNDVVDNLRKNLDIELADKKSDAIALQLRGSSKQLDETVLDVLMDTYNSRRLNRRRETAAMEVEYCNDRLETLMAQLAESEHKVEDFKRRHNTFAMKVDSAGWISKAVGSRVESEKAQNELAYYDQVIFALQRDKNNNSFIPATFDGENRNPLAEQYNELVAKKHDLERSATDENPALKNINSQLSEMRNTLITNFSQNVELSRKNLASIYSLRGEAESELREAPAIERELFDLMRDKYIKNEIYLYLLQRREAADLRLHAVDTYGFVVDRAWSEVKPILTRTFVAYGLAFVFTLFVPTFILLYFMRRRDGLQQPMDMAFIGLEENCVDGHDGGISALRSRIISNRDVNTIYTVDMQCTEKSPTLEQLSESMAEIGVKTIVIGPDDIMPGKDNVSVYLTRRAEQRLEELRQKYEYVFVRLPNIDHIKEIASAVDAPNAALLVMATAIKSRRKQVRHLLRGQLAEHILIYIRPKKEME